MFSTKSCKNLAKTKNQKKSTLWPNGYLLAPHSLWSFVFFVFSKFFCFKLKVAKTSRKPKTKKQILDTMALWLPLGPTYSVEFCFLFFFSIREVFLFLTKNKQKPRQNQNQNKKNKLSTLWPYGYPLAPHSLWGFVFFFLFCFFFDFLPTSGRRFAKKNINL